MGERDIIALLVELFEKYQISYILTGSFACSFWGHPRATHDIDFVIEIEPPKKKNFLAFLKKLGKQFEVDLSAAETAIDEHKQFNIFYPENLLKIDFWIAKDDGFEKSKFRRRVFVKLFGKKVAIVSAEDLILTKLSWVKIAYSERHLRDCVGILEMQRGKLDKAYLLKTAGELGVSKLLTRARSEKYF